MIILTNIGDKILFGNPEDMNNLRILSVNNVFEVSRSETYFEIIEITILPNNTTGPFDLSKN